MNSTSVKKKLTPTKRATNDPLKNKTLEALARDLASFSDYKTIRDKYYIEADIKEIPIILQKLLKNNPDIVNRIKFLRDLFTQPANFDDCVLNTLNKRRILAQIALDTETPANNRISAMKLDSELENGGQNIKIGVDDSLAKLLSKIRES